MKSKQKTTKAKKAQIKVRDINPKSSPTGGRKHKHGGQQPVEYLKYNLKDVQISG